MYLVLDKSSNYGGYGSIDGFIRVKMSIVRYRGLNSYVMPRKNRKCIIPLGEKYHKPKVDLLSKQSLFFI